ncbi:MAG TPA: response regulator transcription factor [Armatimonadota bacterium]|nr:response regulator transcription factor [Armatimonadota bacterium]
MSEVRVLVVDDQNLLREGIVSLLRRHEGLKVVGEASNGREALRKVHELEPDVVLMDVKMPVMDGVTATRQIRQQNPRTRVVLLTMFPDEDSIAEGLSAGACGFLLKDINPDELVRAIRSARAGDAPLDPRVAQHVLLEYSRLAHESTSRQMQSDGLSVREIDILRCVAKGWSNKQIAADREISEKTVKTHLRNIFRKLDLNDRTQAAVYVVTKGL